MQMPQSIKHTTQGLSTQSQPRSAQRSLVKVESGINGLLPTSWAPSIYSVSLLTKLRCALTGHCFLPLAAVRSFLARICQTQKTNQELRKNHRGLDNVGFIGASPLCFFPRVQSEDASPTSHGRRPIFIATKYMLFRGQDTSPHRKSVVNGVAIAFAGRTGECD